VRSDYKWVRVTLESICYLEGNRDYVTLHLVGSTLRTQQSLQRFEASLPATRFARIHKSFLVSLDKVDFVEQGRVSVQGNFLPIGDHYRAALLQRIERK